MMLEERYVYRVPRVNHKQTQSRTSRYGSELGFVSPSHLGGGSIQLEWLDAVRVE